MLEAHITFSWLQEIYHDYLIKANQYEIEKRIRACLRSSHDRSSYYVDFMYLHYFQDISKVNQWFQGVADLAFLYNYLVDATKLKIKQMVGYCTLLQFHIDETLERGRENHVLYIWLVQFEGTDRVIRLLCDIFFFFYDIC